MNVIERLRREYHAIPCNEICGYRPESEIPNIADSDNRLSRQLSILLLQQLTDNIAVRDVRPQTIGQRFAEITRDFIEAAFANLQHLRPGTWSISTSQAAAGIAAFDQYEHISRLQDVLNKNPELKTALGGDYLITPDIILARHAEPDENINKRDTLVGNGTSAASLSPLRERNVPNCPMILHASISCKWTIRSDRAQNTRTEALNLIRNRKGKTPHIVAVTFEPLPSRLASLALGTGDLDCMYHVALHELAVAVDEEGQDDAIDLLRVMVEGRRLRDISDLPLDLAI